MTPSVRIFWGAKIKNFMGSIALWAEGSIPTGFSNTELLLVGETFGPSFGVRFHSLFGTSRFMRLLLGHEVVGD